MGTHIIEFKLGKRNKSCEDVRHMLDIWNIILS